MVKKVLAAIDFSDNNEPIFEQAVTLAAESNAQLMLLHVLSYEEKAFPFPALSIPPYDSFVTERILKINQEEWEKYEKEGLKLLKSFTDRATAAGVQAAFTQLLGSSGRSICEYAQKWEAEVIVIGRRGNSGLAELFLGSVSNYVVHHTHCSVFIVQSPLSPLAKE